jgi:signal transduction histidine kinase
MGIDTAGDGPRRRSPLDQLDRIFDETCGRVLVQRGVRERAKRWAEGTLKASGGPRRAVGVALLAYAAELVVAHAVELAASQPELRALVEKADEAGLVPRGLLAHAVLRAPELLHLPTAVAFEVQLGLIAAFADASAVSLWTLQPNGELRHLSQTGDFDAGRGETRRLARSLLGATKRQERTRSLAGIRIEVPGGTAAVIARGRTATTGRRKVILEAAAPVLSATLELDELLARRNHSREAVVAAAERQLARLRFDLHDGPQQDVMLLAEDLRLLRSQLEVVMNGRREKLRILGRLDDLQARLIAIDGDLRRISSFVQSPFMSGESFPEALDKVVEDFSARAGIEPGLALEGDFGGLSDSQQITLLGLIREALSNVREHSQAKHVRVAVSAGPAGVRATITDDGQGFEPETTLVAAARGGHLGLVGMHERVQMLGGTTHIESRPGGPTVISAELPPFVGGA